MHTIFRSPTLLERRPRGLEISRLVFILNGLNPDIVARSAQDAGLRPQVF